MHPSLPPLTAPEEALLVSRLQARDEYAWRTLYAHYAPALRAVIGRLVPDAGLAEDVLQDGLLKAWLGIGGYDAARGRLFTWLVRLCCNHALDALRSPRHQFHRRHRPLDAPGAQRARAPAFNPEHIGVRELTHRLQDRQRAVVDLFYFGGHTQAEIAARFNIPLATVKTRARTALHALARLAR